MEPRHSYRRLQACGDGGIDVKGRGKIGAKAHLSSELF